MKKLVCCVLFCFGAFWSNAQQYLLFFTDKGGTRHNLQNTATYLGPKAMERRQRYGLVTDSTDLPVSDTYLSQVKATTGVTLLNTSRWLNAVSLRVTDPRVLNQLTQLPFVKSTQMTGNRIRAGRQPAKTLLGKAKKRSLQANFRAEGGQEEAYSYGRSLAQVNLHNGSFLHNLGLDGKNMLIGMLDAGYFRYNTLPAFDSARASGRIIDTWDFVARESSVAEDDAHGMYCLSIIAARIPGTFVGTAPAASFLLYRSEDAASETLIEEFNWVCAAERVDSAGGDLISSSLGYSTFDGGRGSYSYADLNGDRTISVQGADLAARKGILVVNSAGNSGNDDWKYINTPADGDSVLAVGAVNSQGLTGSFSSYGPSADGRIKPDVASVGVGTIIQGANGSITSGNGTSFSGPNMAGLAASLWQGFPELNNMAIIDALKAAATLAPAPDDRQGFGIPDMKKAMGILIRQYARVSPTPGPCAVTLNWQSKDAGAMRYIVERRDPGSTNFVRVGVQNGNSGGWGNRSYQFTDFMPSGNGSFSYRILQELDTTASGYTAVYLDTVSATPQGACSGISSYSVVPNPVSGDARIRIAVPEALGELELAVFDNLGQRVMVERRTKPEGITLLTLPASRLAAGKYYVRIFRGKSQLTTLEFVKL